MPGAAALPDAVKIGSLGKAAARPEGSLGRAVTVVQILTVSPPIARERRVPAGAGRAGVASSFIRDRVPTMTITKSIPPSGIRGLTLRVLAASCAVAGVMTTGCQVDVGGQTLPSAYYLEDDIQYFPAGPEFKLSKEAAAQKAYKKELAEKNDGAGYQP